ncbi:MAG TPA: hypothetical protein P5140_08120 [Methanofastidiosum sp.]|nr:hypothetical protein [Methanofastidiosum sp.]
MAHIVYNEFLYQLAAQTLNLGTDTLKVALLSNAYTPNKDHAYFSDINSNEVTGTGYTAGGALLTGITLTKQDSSDNVKVTGNDVTWVSSTITARYAVIYKATGTPGTSPLILCFDFGTDKQSIDGNFTIEWASEGIFTLSQAV